MNKSIKKFLYIICILIDLALLTISLYAIGLIFRELVSGENTLLGELALLGCLMAILASCEKACENRFFKNEQKQHQ